MNRRELLKKLGIGAAMIPVAPAILANIKPAVVPPVATAANTLTAMRPELYAVKGSEYVSGVIRIYHGAMPDESKIIAKLGFSEPWEPWSGK